MRATVPDYLAGDEFRGIIKPHGERMRQHPNERDRREREFCFLRVRACACARSAREFLWNAFVDGASGRNGLEIRRQFY